MNSSARFITTKPWSFIPGPADLVQPINSQDLQDIPLYLPDAIAESFLRFPGMQLVHLPTPSWWEWLARWESNSDFIEVGMTLFDGEQQSWGGSPIQANCSLHAIQSLLSHLRSRHSGVWLHDPECVIHTERSLIDTVTS